MADRVVSALQDIAFLLDPENRAGGNGLIGGAQSGAPMSVALARLDMKRPGMVAIQIGKIAQTDVAGFQVYADVSWQVQRASQTVSVDVPCSFTLAAADHVSVSARMGTNPINGALYQVDAAMAPAMAPSAGLATFTQDALINLAPGATSSAMLIPSYARTLSVFLSDRTVAGSIVAQYSLRLTGFAVYAEMFVSETPTPFPVGAQSFRLVNTSASAVNAIATWGLAL